MFRAPLRAANAISRHAVVRTTAPRCSLSTAPPHRQSRSWKSSFARWGLAGAIVYYYNTSNVFAEEPHVVHAPPRATSKSEPYSSIETAAKEKKLQSRNDTESAPLAVASNANSTEDEHPAIESPEALEEEAAQQGAFNEETGEINWDCPCLGGMAYGPCGEQFRAAFSCFVFSKEDPKGLECIDHFKTMQNCFREHPDIYGSELDEDEVADSIKEDSEAETDKHAPQLAQKETRPEHSGATKQSGDEEAKRGKAVEASKQVREDYGSAVEVDSAVPRSAHDAR